MRSPTAIQALRARIEQIEAGHKRPSAALPFGIAAIDQHLPGGGLAEAALHEVAGGGNGAIDGAAAALFAAGIAARTSGKVLWCLVRRISLRQPCASWARSRPSDLCRSGRREDSTRLL